MGLGTNFEEVKPLCQCKAQKGIAAEGSGASRPGFESQPCRQLAGLALGPVNSLLSASVSFSEAEASSVTGEGGGRVQRRGGPLHMSSDCDTSVG